jgi:hypothetical protein
MDYGDAGHINVTAAFYMIGTMIIFIRLRDAKNEPGDNCNRDPHAPAAGRGGDEFVFRYR